MKRRLACILLVAGLAGLVLSAREAPAQVLGPAGPRLGGPGLAGLGVYRSPASLYSLGRLFVPPYFSIHPPVYYSYPVPRTYGYSPFAYPGSTMTPEIVLPPAQVRANPYYRPGAPQPSPEHVADSQGVTLNPYFRSSSGDGLVRLSLPPTDVERE